ncbi:hypothetical protein X971_4361 [Agrobacterium tumefaciens LBA4213 (Ach5)]|nr:hypothetical protein X971_4361 [Agrobacterium tumefaciens LBA4213 (Ach5)]
MEFIAQYARNKETAPVIGKISSKFRANRVSGPVPLPVQSPVAE